MSIRIKREDFEKIYEKTYNGVLKFAVVKCNNIEDINDIIQDTYLELLKIVKKKKILEIENINNYIFGIENNIVKRHFYKKKKDNVVLFYNDENNLNKNLEDNFDLEANIINKNNGKKSVIKRRFNCICWNVCKRNKRDT